MGKDVFQSKYVNTKILKMDRYAYMKVTFSELKIFTFEHKVREMGDYSVGTTNTQGSVHNFFYYCQILRFPFNTGFATLRSL